ARSAAAWTVGSVLSTETLAGSVAVLPAWSTAVPVTGWSLPSPATTWSGVQEAIPESASSQRKWTVTSELFQPLALAGGDWVWPVLGALRSMFTGALSALVVLPALSDTEALANRPVPSPVIELLGGAGPARPESASPAVHATATSSLYHLVPCGSVPVGAPTG